ncbi:hypothetical protein OAE79_00070 [Rhodopirellula sp.]|nr:hypothetical protein [Rhodopirellula sp.]MDB4678707.1 hypothetical protein [Rhodopirellula sp.]
MNYKVIVVSEKTECGGKTTGIGEAIERESNRWASQGYVLVTAYQQQVSQCGNNSAVGAVLIFAKRK